MPTPAVEQQRMAMAAAALLASALTFLALRSIRDGRVVEARALPAADMATLSPYLRPLRELSKLARGNSNTVAVARDPFSATAAAGGGTPPRIAVGSPTPASAQAGGAQWVVSSILVEGSKKSAIVNDMWVTIGDTLGGGSHLTAVERDHIVVTDARGVRHNVPIQGGESW
jgi:hypothetical protein